MRLIIKFLGVAICLKMSIIKRREIFWEAYMRKNKPGAGRPIIMNHPWGELARSVGGLLKLAEKLGISRATLNRWSKGERRVPAMAMKEVERLCKYYEIEVKKESAVEKLERT